MSLLEIRDLYKVYGQGAKAVPALRGVDLDVDRGETVALVGESGCGKTTLGRVVVGLQPSTSGDVVFGGERLDDLVGTKGFRSRVQMVFQHPDSSLNPRFRVGTTVREPRRLMKGGSRTEVEEHVDEVLTLVGLGPAYKERRPRQLSGGQQQRVAIARALICDPELVVLDEPTSSLDQSVQGRIISLLRDIQDTREVAYLFISHDLSTVRRIADRVAVMYLGRVVEVADTETLFEDPQHPYTKALLSAVPIPDPVVEEKRRRIILEGDVPSPVHPPKGCNFSTRCPVAIDRCFEEDPEFREVASRHWCACHLV